MEEPGDSVVFYFVVRFSYRATRKPEARPTEHRLAGLQGNPLVEPTSNSLKDSGSANEPLVGTKQSVTTGNPLKMLMVPQ